MSPTSRLPNFHQLKQSERHQMLIDLGLLSPEESHYLHNTGHLSFEQVDHMVENVIGTFNLPLGIATNMIINGEERLIPMATEESSVVAAVCNAAKQCRSSGGFHASVSGNIMIAQIQLTSVCNPYSARLNLLSHESEIKQICDEIDPVLIEYGGGFKKLEIRLLTDTPEPMVIVHLLVDTQDAMGANAVNSMAEAVAPKLAQWTGGKANLRILSNLADQRLARVTATWTLDDIGGESVRDAMLSAYHFAYADPYRAATHNKGIMNGISAVVLATGNDTRAVEAGAHAYAARSGQYRSLTHWETDPQGNLSGALEMPLAVGLIGGATKVHPTAQIALNIIGARKAQDLAEAIVSVGLAQNFAAMKALATTGIQKGHMALHAKNIAMMAGASGDRIEEIARQMIALGKIRIDIAKQLLEK